MSPTITIEDLEPGQIVTVTLEQMYELDMPEPIEEEPEEPEAKTLKAVSK